MTCAEFRIVFAKGPLKCTAAERSAVMKHIDECKLCGPATEARMALAIAVRPISTDKIEKIIDLGIKDFLDPEA